MIQTSARILLIEDDEIIRMELKILLEKYGYDVLTIEDFGNAARFASDMSPHLVLLDINLPVYDGYHICKEIRKTSKIPIIVVTSRDSDMDELMSMNLGADDFITKPYSPHILLAREAIQQELWQSDAFIDDNTLTVNVNRLRATLATIGLGDVIHTKRGQGYCLQ